MKLKILFIVTMFITTLTASVNNPFILKHDGLIDQRAQDKIKEIGLELKSKLNTNVYLYIVEDNRLDIKSGEKRAGKFRVFEDEVLKLIKTTSSYAVLIIAVDQTFINIRMSEDLKSIVNKKDIIYEYVVPLLASKDKNSLFAKTSAASLNGYAQIADSIATSKNIQLDSSIGSGGKTAGTIWKVLMYSLVLFGIGAYAVIVMKQRKN